MSDPMQVQAAAGYAGDVSPQLAWLWVQSGQALMVDVRTDAERAWVGAVPQAHALAWKQWPGMAMNPDFDAGIQAGCGRPKAGAAVPQRRAFGGRGQARDRAGPAGLQHPRRL